MKNVLVCVVAFFALSNICLAEGLEMSWNQENVGYCSRAPIPKVCPTGEQPDGNPNGCAIDSQCFDAIQEITIRFRNEGGLEPPKVHADFTFAACEGDLASARTKVSIEILTLKELTYLFEDISRQLAYREERKQRVWRAIKRIDRAFACPGISCP